jgi:acyl-CoA thioester hydrolase
MTRETEDAAPFVHELRVRYNECDAQGIVFNANYLVYFDVAFTELWRAALGPWQETTSQGVDFVVAEANVLFRAPARFDEELQIAMRIVRLGSSAITTEFLVRRDGELLATGHLRHVCIDHDSWGKTDLPDRVRRGLRRFAADGAENAVALDANERL